MKLLVVTDVPYWQGRRGCDRRIRALTDWLSQHAQIKLCFVGELAPHQWHLASSRLPYPVTGPGAPGFWHAVASRLTRKPGGTSDPAEPINHAPSSATLDQFKDSAIARFVEKEATAFRPDIVLIEYLSFVWLADRIRQASPSTQIAVDTHDVMHLRQAEFQRYGLSSWLQIDADREAEELKTVDAVIAISEQDRDTFRKLLSDQGPTVLLAHHPASEDALALRLQKEPHKPESTPRTGSDPLTEPVKIGFIGSAGAANQKSLNVFLDEVWPHLSSAAQPPLQLVIAGPLFSSDAAPKTQGDIRWWGPVDEVADFYCQIDIAINPATIHSGFKIKSLEALAWGCPLVTTEAGMAGLEPARDSAALVADNWNAFADGIQKLAGDPALRKQMAENALRIVSQNYRPDATFADLLDWMRQASGRAV